MSNRQSAIASAQDIATRVLVPAARQNDREARFSSDAVAALGASGLLGLTLPADVGGAGRALGTSAEVMTVPAEADFDCNLHCDYCCVRSSPRAVRSAWSASNGSPSRRPISTSRRSL